MRLLTTTTITLLVATSGWAGEVGHPGASLPGNPIVLDPSQLDQVTAGAEDSQLPNLDLQDVLQVIRSRIGVLAGTAADSGRRVPGCLVCDEFSPTSVGRAIREHILLARQVGLPAQD